jgi:hypothetical protein
VYMGRLLRYFPAALILGLIVIIAIVIPVLAASLTLSPSRGTVGSTVTIDGSGFTASTDFTLKFDSTSIDTVSSDDSGVLDSYELEVPEKQAGAHTITVGTTSKTFTIIPKITLSKTSAAPGASITISGTGFAGSDSAIQVSIDDIIVLTDIDSDSKGSWSSTFTVPSLGSGSHTVTAADSASTPNTASASLSTVSVAAISLSKTSGAAGSSLTVYGAGFVGSESSIVVTFDGNPVGSPTSANASGSWSLTFNIPSSPGGTHSIDAYGSVTVASSVADKTLSVTPGLSLSKTSGPPGTQITITGNSFSANETGINVTWDSSPIGNPVNAGPTGSWTSTITIPASVAGAHIINAYGTTTTSGVVNLVFTVGAGISTNKTSGPAGTSVTVSGTGFAASEKSIAITFDSTTVASNITANTSGAWTANFSVPTSAGGDHTISASGATTKATAVQTQIFTTLPSVIPDTSTGPAGSPVSLSGSGFAPNQPGIKILFDGQEMTTVSAKANGDWTATLTIPAVAAGSHTIGIAGAGNIDLNISPLSYKIKAAASLTPETGTVGTTVIVKGTGFNSGGSITITYDDNNIVKTTADNSGNFSKSIIIPKSVAGEHEIRASDPNNSVSLIFNIEGNPPPVPKPASPADGQRLGFINKIAPTFTWVKVPTNGQVTYTFQLDSNPDFSNPLVEISGLTATKYTLNQSEALPKGDYYWRVKAIDTASNESPWSQPQYLKSGLMSPGLFILLLILIIAALAIGLYFLLTKVILKRRKAQAVTSPEIVIPEIVNADFQQIEGDKKTLPWRLALPQAPPQPKGSKSLSSEDQARLRTIIDFAKSLPLPQPDSTTLWLVEMAENNTGNAASPALYAQLLKGEIQVRYEPAWMRHPTFLDLQALLEGQPIMQDLTAYVEAINLSATSAVQILQDIYHDATAEITWDLIANGGWVYISGVYSDGVGWFQGKNLREPSDRDYTVKTESAAGEANVMGLYGDQNTAFTGLLVKAPGDNEVQQLRMLHLKLRRAYRNNDKLKDLVRMVSQLEVQRNRLVSAFSQFNRLST